MSLNEPTWTESYERNADLVGQGWVELGTIDEADAYEVDETHVLYHPERQVFLVRSASGCSCWDGNYVQAEFPTLEAVENDLAGPAKPERYNPSLKGVEQLMAESRAAFEKVVQS